MVHARTYTNSGCTRGNSHVIGQVVFIQSVGLKAVRRCIKVVTSDATYKAFSLHRNQ